MKGIEILNSNNEMRIDESVNESRYNYSSYQR